jgi:hypothetical protein
MDSTRVIGAIVWIMISDFIGGIGGLSAGWLAMACFEPVVGDLAGCVLLVSVPMGLCAGGLLGVASLGWFAGLEVSRSRPALSHS